VFDVLNSTERRLLNANGAQLMQSIILPLALWKLQCLSHLTQPYCSDQFFKAKKHSMNCIAVFLFKSGWPIYYQCTDDC